MSTTPVRNFTRLAIAIVVAALVIAAGILAASYFRPATTTITVTGPTITTQSTIVTTVTQTSTTPQTVTGSSSAATNVTTANIPGTNPPGICIDPGQPGGAFFRVLNDSTSLPMAGANVTAVANGDSPGCGPGGMSTVFHETYTFTTNQTEWYSLSVVDADSYNFTITYLGHTYSFGISLRPVISSCGTLYLPSGTTSTPTYPEPGTACNSG